MVSLITVFIKSLDYCAPIFFDSILKRTKLISEVIIADVESTTSYEEKWEDRGIKFLKFGCPTTDCTGVNQGYQHALGLHECIDRASQEYILFADPDTFFYIPVDETYVNLMTKHDLNIIGCSHHTAVSLGQTFFPYIASCMVKKSTLPDENFLKGHLFERAIYKMTDFEKTPNPDSISRDGKYLIPGPLPAFYKEFPTQDPENCLYDTGCNLLLWNKERNGKWLSFQTDDCHIYTTKYYRTNFSLKERLPFTKLIYHIVGGSRDSKYLEQFEKAYSEAEEDDDDD